MVLFGTKRFSFIIFRLQSRARVNSQYNEFSIRTRAINTSASRFRQKVKQQEQGKERSFTGNIF
jgi:hypothetical protein